MLRSFFIKKPYNLRFIIILSKSHLDVKYKGISFNDFFAEKSFRLRLAVKLEIENS